MTIFWDEKLEGSGYEEIWTGEVADSGCTVDEDADPSDVSSPANWGNDCLKCISADSTNQQAYVGKTFASSYDPVYQRFEMVITGENLANDEKATIWKGADTSWQVRFEIRLYQESGALLLKLFNSKTDYSDWEEIDGPAVSLNTLYRVEIEYDVAGGNLNWKVNGNSQTGTTPKGTEEFGRLEAGIRDQTGSGALTIYYDLIALDDADWIGAAGTTKSVAGSIPAMAGALSKKLMAKRTVQGAI